MSIKLSDNIENRSNKSLDSKRLYNGVRDYTDVAEALATVPAIYRGEHEVFVVAGVEYWWESGAAVVKPGGGTGGGPTPGNLTSISGGTNVDIGGNATKNTVLNLGIFGWLLQRAGVKIEIEESTGNLVLKTEGTKFTQILSELGIEISAPNILLKTLTENNDLTRVLVQDSTGKIFRRDAASLISGPSTFFFNILDYGAVGDGVTDDTAAIQAAITAATAASAGVILIPGKSFFIDGTLTLDRSVRFVGVTQSAGLRNQISSAELDKFGPVQFTSRLIGADNKNMFVFNKNAEDEKTVCVFEHLSFDCPNVGASATSGSFIQVNDMAQDCIFEACTFFGGYFQIDIQSAFYFRIDKCHFSSAARASVNTGNNVRTDTGDFLIINNTFSSGIFNTAALNTVAINWFAGGGLKLIGNKFDACQFNVATAFVYDLYAENILDPTSDFIIMGNSFENWSVSAIKCQGNQAPYVRNIHICGNQFAPVGTSGPAIDIDLMSDIIITDFLMRDWSGSVAAPGIRVTNSIAVSIGLGQIRDYTSNIDVTGSTNVDLHYKWLPGQTGKILSFDEGWIFPKAAGAEGAIQYADVDGNLAADAARLYLDADGKLHIGGEVYASNYINIRKDVNGLVGFCIENRNTGSDARAESYMIEDLNNYAGFGRFNKDATGSWIGTSIPNASTIYLYTNKNGVQATDPVVINGNKLFVINGTDMNKMGMASTDVGVKISPLSSLDVEPTAKFELPVGDTTTPLMKIPSGPMLTTPQNGAIESDGTNLFWTDNAGVRWPMAGPVISSGLFGYRIIVDDSGELGTVPV